MFTLFSVLANLASLMTTMNRRQNLPINASPWYPHSNSFAAEATFFENSDIPRFQTRATKHNAAFDLQCAVQCPNLLDGLVTRWWKPVHAVHDHDNRQGAGAHARDDFADLICVDAQTVEGGGLAKFDVRLGRKVRRVRGWRVVSQQCE